MRTVVLTVSMLLVAAPGLAETFVIDQVGPDASPGAAFRCQGPNTYGFSFTPSVDRVARIDLEMSCCISPTATVRLDVHEGSLVGPIVGSAQLTLQDGFSSVIGDGVIDPTSFRFSPPIVVTPGTEYFVDIVHVAGQGWCITLNFRDNYPGGVLYTNGVADPTSDGVFQTVRFLPAGQLYWVDTEQNLVQRSELDGSNVETIATVPGSGPNGVAVDLNGGLAYWIECCGSVNGRIRVADAEGGNEGTFFGPGPMAVPQRILFDPDNDWLFFSDDGNQTIERIGTDGLGLIELLGPPGPRPLDMALDPIADKLYWTEGSSGDTGIHRMNLDGTMKEPVLTEVGGADIDDPHGIAIDADDSRMYWADRGRDEIRRANLDGSGVEILIDATIHPILAPSGIALDPDSGKLYWSDTTRDTISMADLDGSNPVDIVTGVNFARALDLEPVPEPGALTGLVAGLGLLAALGRMRRRSSRSG